MRQAFLSLAGAALSLICIRHAHAEDWPRKPISLIVPYAAGGGSDILARSLGETMGKALGQQILVENKPGASGTLGTNFVAKAPADGYTLLLAINQSVLTNQFLFHKLPYDPRKELAFISQIASAPLLLLVPASTSINTVKELQQALRAPKANASCGSWGAGSYPHLACAHMVTSWKTEISHVAYKGEAPMLQELVGGQLSFAMASIISAKPYLDSGRLRAIAVTGTQRIAALGKLPTFSEAGFADPEFRMSGWIALMAPLATPRPVLERLQAVTQQALKTPELARRQETLGLTPLGTSAEQFRANYAADWPVWERLVKTSGAQLD